MHIRVEYATVTRTVEDMNKKIEINSAEDETKAIEAAIGRMEQMITELQDEYGVIHAICCKFAYVLNENSNTVRNIISANISVYLWKRSPFQPYNRYIEPYLDMLMSEEQKKLDANPHYSREKYQSLKQMKEAHQQSIKILAEAIKLKQVNDINLDDIYKFKDQLVSLKYSGAQFRQMMDSAAQIKHKAAAEMPEKELDLTVAVAKKQKSFWQQFWMFG